MAIVSGPPGSPQYWDENVRAYAWRFNQYRTIEARSFAEFANNRDQWDAYNVGRPGRRPLRREPIQNWTRHLLQRANGFADLNNAPPLHPHPQYIVARNRAQALVNVFGTVPNIQYLRALGFGGNGLALKFRNTARNYDFVIKAALSGWESKSIRDEIRETRKMKRAAHCVQMKSWDELGIPEQGPYLWEEPPTDDSSDSGESSGDESRKDGPGPPMTGPGPVPMTRRMQHLHKNDEVEAKKARQLERVEKWLTDDEERGLYIQNRRRQGVEPPPAAYDPAQELRVDVIILEFVENGDLQNLLYRLNEANMIIPNRILWGFWLCMVRACVAMQYPPRKFHPRRREPPEFRANGVPVANTRVDGKTVGNDLYEDIPVARRRWAQKRQVHFDIDPQNILISGLDIGAHDNEHQIVPRLKLADFGLAEEVKPRKSNLYYFGRRMKAKYGYFAPEQFGIEWDYIQADNGNPVFDADGPEVAEEDIAGNYGPHTNVFQIGIVGWQLMTKMLPPTPPQLQRKVGEHLALPNNYCASLLTENAYNIYDYELRRTIALCLAHDPRDRPTTRTLLQQAKIGINKVFPNETDQMIRDWIQRLIFNA